MDTFKDWQPPKELVVVPQFVADWYEINKFDLEVNIRIRIADIHTKDRSIYSELDKWFMNEMNIPLETLIRMRDGYTIEKEQLYRVIFPKTTIDGTDDGAKYMLIQFKPSGRIFTSHAYNSLDDKVDFTEKEIRAIDERYMSFAVEVVK